jgi:hypothetical protein
MHSKVQGTKPSLLTEAFQHQNRVTGSVFPATLENYAGKNEPVARQMLAEHMQDRENHDWPLKLHRELVCKEFETGQHPKDFLLMEAPC